MGAPLKRARPDLEGPLRRLIGDSPAMRRLREQIATYAPSGMPMVFLGEPGTGKNLCARVSWEITGAKGPFESVNCAPLPDDLLESQLFGHEKGAFTGATHKVRGAIARANNGVLFLDEIGELSSRAQAKLLEVLETGEYLPLGSEKKLRSVFRLMAATNADLETMVERHAFRRDLYDRLGLVHLWLPPLRDRREDIPTLTKHLLAVSQVPGDDYPRRVTEEALTFLQSLSWKNANIRRLKSVVEAATVKAQGESHIHVIHLEEVLALRSKYRKSRERLELDADEAGHSSSSLISLTVCDRGHTWKEIIAETERYKVEAVLATLRQVGGSRRRAAAELGTSEATIYRYLKNAEELGIAPVSSPRGGR